LTGRRDVLGGELGANDRARPAPDVDRDTFAVFIRGKSDPVGAIEGCAHAHGLEENDPGIAAQVGVAKDPNRAVGNRTPNAPENT